MAINYTSHPTELVKPGELQTIGKLVGIKELRNAIPKHCFKPSIRNSLLWICHDIILAITLASLAYRFIPQVETPILRYATWAAYGWLEGLVFTGIWVLGHESGHGTLFPSSCVNDTLGFLFHSFLLTPYFSWKSTHRRHHIYANNMKLDHNYVPPRRSEYLQAIGTFTRGLNELTEDAPVLIFLRILMQQLLGFPWYLLTNITAARESAVKPPSKKFLGNSHFAPWGSLFRAEEAHLILLSDLGIIIMATLLHLFTLKFGFTTTFLLYFQPYIWVNHWIVAITYLHHTHPSLPKFEPEAWNFLKGATATIDRPLGFIGRYFLHDIVDYHVVHHLFSRIPFYYAKEATEAIKLLMGDSYHVEKSGTFMYGIWESFTQCQYVEPDSSETPADRALWYKAGPILPPQTKMQQRWW